MHGLTNTELTTSLRKLEAYSGDLSKPEDRLARIQHQATAAHRTDTDSTYWLSKLALSKASIKATNAIAAIDAILSTLSSIATTPGADSTEHVAVANEHLKLLRFEDSAAAKQRRANLAARSMVQAASWSRINKSLITTPKEAFSKVSTQTAIAIKEISELLPVLDNVTSMHSVVEGHELLGRAVESHVDRVTSVFNGAIAGSTIAPRQSTSDAIVAAASLSTATRTITHSSTKDTLVGETVGVSQGASLELPYLSAYTINSGSNTATFKVNGDTIAIAFPPSSSATITWTFSSLTVAPGTDAVKLLIDGNSSSVFLLDPGTYLRSDLKTSLETWYAGLISVDDTGSSLIIKSLTSGPTSSIEVSDSTTIAIGNLSIGVVYGSSVTPTQVIATFYETSSGRIKAQRVGTSLVIANTSTTQDNYLKLSGAAVGQLGMTRAEDYGKTNQIQCASVGNVKVGDVVYVNGASATVSKIIGTTLTLSTPVNVGFSGNITTESAGYGAYRRTATDIRSWKRSTNFTEELGRMAAYAADSANHQKLITLCNTLRNRLMSLHAINESFNPPKVKEVLAIHKALLHNGFDRAADLYIHGGLLDMVKTTSDTASYKNYAQNSIASAMLTVPLPPSGLTNHIGVTGDADINLEGTESSATMIDLNEDDLDGFEVY
jgi:hypothetical protein